MLSKSTRVTGQQFCIEDYFSEELLQSIINDEINKCKNNSSLTYPKNLMDIVKKRLYENCKDYTNENMVDFKILLDKLIEILQLSN